jgi:hypothetical protein
VYEELIRKVVDFHDDLLRNIKTIRRSQALFDDLSDDPQDQAVAAAAEATDRIASAAPLISRPFDYGTVITYPFVNFNGHITRFSDGLHYGVWYGSLDIETTVYETVYHWHRFVMDSYSAEDRPIRGERRVFSVRCDAILIDLQGKHRREPGLVDRRDYSFTQPLGRYVKDQGQNGLLVKSARADGVTGAILRQEVLSNVRDVCHLTYVMNPKKDSVRAERAPGKLWVEVVPSRLY